MQRLRAASCDTGLLGKKQSEKSCWVTGVISFSLPTLQRCVIPQSPDQQWGRGLRTHAGMWSKPEISTAVSQAGAPVVNVQREPPDIYFYTPFRREGWFAERRQALEAKKPSGKSYPPSLANAPVAPSSTAPTNSKLLAASICCDAAPLVHVPRREVSRLVPNVAYVVFPTSWIIPAWFTGTSAALVCFFNLCDFLPWILCLMVVKRDSAQERRRAPVKAWAGSGRLSQPALNSSAGQCAVSAQHRHLNYRSIYLSITYPGVF